MCGGIRTRKEKVFQFGIYQGEVNQQDELSGQGVMTFNDGSYYDGQWKANKRHGLGTFQYASGSSYHGEYKENKKNGFGVQTYVEKGETYNGTWLEGSRHGWGVLRQADGWLLEGQWKEDKKVGVGIRRNPAWSSVSDFSTPIATHPSSSSSSASASLGTVGVSSAPSLGREPYFVLEVRDNNGEVTRSKEISFSDPICEKPLWKALLLGNSTALRKQVESGEFFIGEWLVDGRRRSTLHEAAFQQQQESTGDQRHSAISSPTVPRLTSLPASSGTSSQQLPTPLTPSLVLRSPRTPSQVILKQGWLYKLDHLGRSWNKRFFVLKMNDTLLYYLKEPVRPLQPSSVLLLFRSHPLSISSQTSAGQLPKGMIELRRYALRVLDGKEKGELALPDSKKRQFIFELWHPELRSYRFAVASSAEREDWYFNLRRFCQSTNT